MEEGQLVERILINPDRIEIYIYQNNALKKVATMEGVDRFHQTLAKAIVEAYNNV